MKAICASVNFDRFTAIPRPPARIRRAAKLEFSSNLRSRKPEAGHESESVDAALGTIEAALALTAETGELWERRIFAPHSRRGFVEA
jgi:hypothetical protein